MKLKLSRDQIMNYVAAVLFVIGAVFMLCNVFGAGWWSFIVGTILGVIAAGLLITAYFDMRHNKNKHENKISKTESAQEESKEETV